MKIEEIYTEDFFEAIMTSEIDTSVECMRIIADYFKCKSVIDLGCGSAIYLKALEELGITDIIGYDGSIHAVTTSLLPEKTLVYDLRTPLVLDRKYDLAMSIEVFEHVDEQYADVLVDNMINCSDKIFITAAVPGQGGTDHINEQTNEYWIEKFEKRGYKYLLYDTEQMRYAMQEDGIIWWIAQNLMLFEKIA